jgi:four helix bundle protein
MKTSNFKIQTPEKIQTSSTKEARIDAEDWPNFESGAAMILKDESSGLHPFDLEERTALFGECIVRFAKKVPLHPANNRLIDQLVGAGTSIGANYCEASEAVSKKDFRVRISTSVKEAKETCYFLRMIVASEPQLAGEARKLYCEGRELHMIFASIYRKP